MKCEAPCIHKYLREFSVEHWTIFPFCSSFWQPTVLQNHLHNCHPVHSHVLQAANQLWIKLPSINEKPDRVKRGLVNTEWSIYSHAQTQRREARMHTISKDFFFFLPKVLGSIWTILLPYICSMVAYFKTIWFDTFPDQENIHIWTSKTCAWPLNLFSTTHWYWISIPSGLKKTRSAYYLMTLHQLVRKWSV